MPKTIQRPQTRQFSTDKVTPSRGHPATSNPFTLEQELEPFGNWVDEPIWVPPKDSSLAMAESMLQTSGTFTPREQRWSSVVDQHRSEFTQVREIDLTKASIRLPKGKFFVSVTEQEHFDQITDVIPACVQTRLDEFLDGPGRQEGVKVYYLKPLCVEVDDDLILTTRDDVLAAVTKIQDEVFSEYRRLYIDQLPKQLMLGAINLTLAIPRRIVQYFVQRRQRAIDAYQARLEFQRRKTALRATRTRNRRRTDACTFDQMLALTSPLGRAAVVELYSMEQDLSRAKRDQLLQIAAGTAPWFVTLSMGVTYFASVSFSLVPPLMVCDPAFVAEMPEAPGVLLKIGHFDEVGGITHVEI